MKWDSVGDSEQPGFDVEEGYISENHMSEPARFPRTSLNNLWALFCVRLCVILLTGMS